MKSVCEKGKSKSGRNRIKLSLAMAIAILALNPMDPMTVLMILKVFLLTRIWMEKLLLETKLHAM